MDTSDGSMARWLDGSMARWLDGGINGSIDVARWLDANGGCLQPRCLDARLDAGLDAKFDAGSMHGSMQARCRLRDTLPHAIIRQYQNHFRRRDPLTELDTRTERY